mgnify:CR=1 FL=1
MQPREVTIEHNLITAITEQVMCPPDRMALCVPGEGEGAIHRLPEQSQANRVGLHDVRG